MTNETQQHALIIGGTGMLRELSLNIAKKYNTVSIIARDKKRLKDLVKEAKQFNGNIIPIALDYCNTKSLKKELEISIDKEGEFDLAIVWIHNTAPNAPYITAKFIDGDYYHILSSSYGDPSKVHTERLHKFKSFSNINYHEIILGFVVDNNYSRWLSHHEISTGIIKAIRKKQKNFVVGTLSPWADRP